MRIRGNSVRRLRQGSTVLVALASLSILASIAFARPTEHPKEPRFKYVAGTEDVLEGCQGRLEVTSEALTFRCAQYAVRVPYGEITLMQYRPNVSRGVTRMKLKWKARPPYGGGKKNRFFTVVFRQQGSAQAMVLQVMPSDMQPYLAEIELQSNQRVEVMRHDDYE